MTENPFPSWFRTGPLSKEFRKAIEDSLDVKKLWESLELHRRKAELTGVAVGGTALKAEGTGMAVGGTVLKAEGTGVAVGGNLLKAEANLATFQADVFRVDAVFRDIVKNRLETSNALRELRNDFPNATRQQIKDLIDPTQLRKDIQNLKNKVRENHQKAQYTDTALTRILPRIAALEARTTGSAQRPEQLRRAIDDYNRALSRSHPNMRVFLQEIHNIANNLR
ncbi:hypothetical protein AB0O07_35715 [Streptomyces sp. NPDC093085]|uniref:hypothetical protein n=1 Tax=Streptomyces sp. NPDC093085 TaxID=3155068 RepID=UPI00341E80B2